MGRTSWGLLFVLALLPGGLEAATIDLSSAVLTLDAGGVAVELKFADGTRWPSAGQPAFAIQTLDGRTLTPETVQQQGDRLLVSFPGGAAAEFQIVPRTRFALFRLLKFEPLAEIQQLRLFSLAAPAGARVSSIINSAAADGRMAAVVAAEPNVRAYSNAWAGSRADRGGCTHEFQATDAAKIGKRAARFTATCNPDPAGWSMRGKNFPQPLDLTGCRAIRAWVHGDGQGQALKIQLYDGAGGYRDNYLPIDFVGWRQVTLTDSPFNTLRYDRVSSLNFYYNSLPANQTVTCLIDQVEAVLERGGAEQVVVLEDFESEDSQLWSAPVLCLGAEVLQRYGIQPAAFGVIACPEKEFFDAMQEFEIVAGLPSPRLGGEWGKRSPWIKRSYFFLTSFSESQFDEALALARRGNFHTILLGQESWCAATGHFEVNRNNFPGGLENLKQTVQRFKDAGFRVGFHFLGTRSILRMPT